MLFISFPIYGQFVVDRPGLINPPDILQENKVQWENGFEYTVFDNKTDNSSINYLNTLARYGLNNNSEIRFGVTYTGLKDVPQNISGISSLSISTKLKIYQNNNSIIPNTSALIQFNLPYGDNNFKPAQTEPLLALVCSNNFSNDFLFTYNLGGVWKSTSILYFYSFSGTYLLSTKTGAILGYYSEISQIRVPRQLVELALTYLLDDNFQVDFWTAYSPFSQSKENVIGVGFAWQIN
jgi:hypothetical protein